MKVIYNNEYLAFFPFLHQFPGMVGTAHHVTSIMVDMKEIRKFARNAPSRFIAFAQFQTYYKQLLNAVHGDEKKLFVELDGQFELLKPPNLIGEFENGQRTQSEEKIKSISTGIG